MNRDSPSGTALLADVGGTNARFAVLRDGAPGAVLHLPVAGYASFYDAAAAALERLGCSPVPQDAVLAFAGPVDGSRAVMTNVGWDTTLGELRRRFGFTHIRLLNDYAALALSLDHFTGDDTRAIGPAPAEPPGTRHGPLAVLGPGSGLGVGALIPAQPHPLPLVSEGGHATLAPCDDFESELFALLRREYSHVSAERLLSGPGLVNLYRTIAAVRKLPPERLDPAEITRRGLDYSDTLCRLALVQFCRLLGSFAGNVALTYGARGGVFLGGGILPRFPEFLAASDFRARFEDKGRFRAYLCAIPTLLISRQDAAFLGLAAAARQFS
ncbi:MAG: glucokinase [Kiloniellaceae bacterium]